MILHYDVRYYAIILLYYAAKVMLYDIPLFHLMRLYAFICRSDVLWGNRPKMCDPAAVPQKVNSICYKIFIKNFLENT